MKTFISTCKAAKRCRLFNYKSVNSVLSRLMERQSMIIGHRAPIVNNKPNGIIKINCSI